MGEKEKEKEKKDKEEKKKKEKKKKEKATVRSAPDGSDKDMFPWRAKMKQNWKYPKLPKRTNNCLNVYGSPGQRNYHHQIFSSTQKYHTMDVCLSLKWSKIQFSKKVLEKYS